MVHLSPAFTHTLTADPLALAALITPQPDPAPEEVEKLPGWYRRQLLTLAGRDLDGNDLGDTTECLSRLVRATLDALRTQTLREFRLDADAPFAIIEMGKLAGSEINYASDVDVMFVGTVKDSVVRRFLALARTCFAIDINLRPEGRNGALIRSVESYEQYWSRWAQPWEFQALLKATATLGPEELCQAFNRAKDLALWSSVLDADQLRELRLLKARAEQAASLLNIKTGSGGIRDVEFSIQLLQLVYGINDSTVRSPNTLEAIRTLLAGGYVAEDDAETLSEGYGFLRALEHRMQLIQLQPCYEIPKDTSLRERIARSLGFPPATAVESFDQQTARVRAAVRHTHERVYFRPLLDAFSPHRGDIPDKASTLLTAFGFRDASRTRSAVEELTLGLARSSQLMRQMLPLLLEWLSDTPDPDEGLLGLRNLFRGFRTPEQIVATFRDSPETARRVCISLGTSPTFGAELQRSPSTLELLSDTTRLRTPPNYFETLHAELDWKTSPEAQHKTLVRAVKRERTRIALAEILGLLANTDACAARSALADATIAHTLSIQEPPEDFAVIALGRYGGNELGIGSDLDLLCVCKDSVTEAIRAARALRDQIGGADPVTHLYDVDFELRPEGKNGPLVKSLAAFDEYFAKWGSTWERQALLRARVVAGNLETGEHFLNAARQFSFAPLTDAEQAEIRLLKARMEKERVSRDDARYHVKLGRGSLSDCEWTVQLLQLQQGIGESNTLRALGQLAALGHLASTDAEILRDSWLFCSRLRSRMHLLDHTSDDVLPTDPQKYHRLTRSLDLPNLRDDYLRVTRRARKVCERVFYAMNGPQA